MNTNMKRTVGAAVLVVAGLTLAACSSSGGSNGSSSSTTSSGGSSTGSSSGGPDLSTARTALAKYLKPPTTITQTVALSTAPPKGTLVYLAQASVPTTAAIGKAAEAAAKAVGWKFDQLSYDPGNPSSLQAAFANALLMHPTAVGVTGIDPTDYASSIAKYKSAGVPIIVTSTATTPITSTVIGLPDVDRSNESEAVASWFATESKGAGHALVAHVTGFPSLQAVVDSLKSDTSKFCPGCSLDFVNIPISQIEKGQGNSLVVSSLRSHPNDKYVIFDDGDFATGISQALSVAGLKSIKVAGLNAQPDQLSGLRAGTQNAWTVDNNKITGYDIVDLAVRYAEKAPATTNDQTEPTQLLTPSTVGSITTWDEPKDALQQYEKLWHVSPTG